MQKCSSDFGKKEHVLNYACQTYQLSRPAKVGAVMALIRECNPATFQQWENWYFENAYSETKSPAKITKEVLSELGERLYSKITEIVIPEWTEAFSTLTMQDCENYIYNLTLNRTYDGYVREKSVVNDHLRKLFPQVDFQETSSELDHAGDIDFMAYIGKAAFGIQIKPITAKANFGGYSLTERMKASFNDFTEKYGGIVFIVLSLDGDISNTDVIKEISQEVERLEGLKDLT